MVLEVLEKDNEVSTFSFDRKWDKNYAKLVLAFVNTISNRVKDLMKNADLVDELYQKAQIVLNYSDDESMF